MNSCEHEPQWDYQITESWRWVNTHPGPHPSWTATKFSWVRLGAISFMYTISRLCGKGQPILLSQGTGKDHRDWVYSKRKINPNSVGGAGSGSIRYTTLNGGLLSLEQSRKISFKRAKETQQHLSATGRWHGKGKHHFKDIGIQCLHSIKSGSGQQRSSPVPLCPSTPKPC